MRVVTKEFTIYKFEELENKVQQKIADMFGESEDDYLEESITDMIDEKLEGTYFIDPKASWSCSSYQCNGVNFSAYIDMEKLLKNMEVKESLKAIAIEYLTIVCNGNKGSYYYPSTSDIDFVNNLEQDYNFIGKFFKTIVEFVENEYMKYNHDFETQIYERVTYFYSIENAKDVSASNEYEFLENGDIYV